MLNVPSKYRRRVDDMKDLALLPAADRRQQRRLATPHVVSAEEAEAERIAKTFMGLDQQALLRMHPTVMLSTLSLNDTIRGALQGLHDTTEETSRHSILEQRRTHCSKELNGLLKHIFSHYQSDSSTNLVAKKRQRALLGGSQPTVLVPTMEELSTALTDERMHFETLTNSTSNGAMMESIARQLQWLIAELGKATERGDLYEHQYKLVLLDYGRLSERMHELEGKHAALAHQLAEQGVALQAERSHSAETAQEANRQIAALRESLRESMDANMRLQSIDGGLPRIALPPLRSSRKAGASTLAALMGGSQGSSTTPPVRSNAASRNVSPRVEAGRGNQLDGAGAGGGGACLSPRASNRLLPPPNHHGTNGTNGEGPPSAVGSPVGPKAPLGAGMLSIDEKEKYLTSITKLRKELAAGKEQLAAVEAELEEARGRINEEKERVGIAERAGQMELHATQQLLKTVRDGHVRQLSDLENAVSEARAKAAANENAVQTLQVRLRESSARLLSLQNLLLSGPSVQTLLVSSATSRSAEAQEASESLVDLADRITMFADQFSGLGAQDFAAIKNHMETFLHPLPPGSAAAAAAGDGAAGCVPAACPTGTVGTGIGDASDELATQPSMVTSPTSLGGMGAPSRSRRKPATLCDQAIQTDEVQWLTHDSRFVNDGPVTYVPSAGTPTQQQGVGGDGTMGRQRSRPLTDSASSRSAAGGRGRSSPTTKPAVGGSLRKGSGKLERRDSGIDDITEEIAVSVAGPDGNSGVAPCNFLNPVDLSPERTPNEMPLSMTSNQTASSALSPSPAAAKGSSMKPTSKSTKVPAASGSKGSLKPKGKGSAASPSGMLRKASLSDPNIPYTDSMVYDGGDGADDELTEDALKANRKLEQDAMRKVAASFKSGGIASTNFDIGSDATNEISANLERMTQLRKQISQAAEQIHQLQIQLEREKKSGMELEHRLADQAKAHAKDAEKILAISKQVDLERGKSEKLSERVSTLYADITGYQERLHALQDEKDQLEESLLLRIEELQKMIETYKKADERTAMIDKERQFLEVCERAIRCLMSAEATSSCGLCLSRLSNPVTITPCGHTCCERCFLLHQAEHDISLPSDAYDALQIIYNYRNALVQFHEDAEKAQADFLAGLIPLPPEAKRPPKAPTGYLTRTAFIRALTGCAFQCPECDKPIGSGYLQQTRLEELCAKLAYVASVVGELQEMGKARYTNELLMSDPNAEIALTQFVIADNSSKSQKQQYVDLEIDPQPSSDDDDA